MSDKKLSEWVRAKPYAALSLCAFVVSAYLCLGNLDYVTLWHDETVVSFISKNLLEQGDILGWDGRNLVGGPNGRSLNEDLRDVAPPVQYLLTAAGFIVFGFTETGARFPHALAGVLALGFFYLILRQQLSNNPRLIFFIFLFAAWSAQLLLYFRQARYYGAVVLCMMVGFYLYERYWPNEKSVSSRRTDRGCCARVLQSLHRRRVVYDGTGRLAFAISRPRNHEAGMDRLCGLRRSADGAGIGVSGLYWADWRRSRPNRRVSHRERRGCTGNFASAVSQGLDLRARSVPLRIGFRGRFSYGFPR